MTIRELIEALEKAADEHGENSYVELSTGNLVASVTPVYREDDGEFCAVAIA